MSTRRDSAELPYILMSIGVLTKCKRRVQIKRDFALKTLIKYLFCTLKYCALFMRPGALVILHGNEVDIGSSFKTEVDSLKKCMQQPKCDVNL